MVTLEKIDQIVERTGVSFEIARDALNVCEGDVIDAIIYIEKNHPDKAKHINSNDLLDTLKEYIRKGNISRILVENNGETILNIPVTFGAIGILLAPVVAIIGVGAAALNQIVVKVVDSEGNVINLNKVTAEKIKEMKKMGEEVSEEFKEKMREKEEARAAAEKAKPESNPESEDEEYEVGSEKDVPLDEDQCHWSEDGGFDCDNAVVESEIPSFNNK